MGSSSNRVRKKLFQWSALVVLVLASALGWWLDHQWSYLKHVDQVYRNASVRYRLALWQTRYLESMSTEEDFTEFRDKVLPRLIPFADLGTLQKLEGLRIPVLSRKAESLLREFVQLAQTAGKPEEVAPYLTTRNTYSAAYRIMNDRLANFKFIAKDCSLTADQLEESVFTLLRKKAAASQFKCVAAAAQSLRKMLLNSDNTASTQSGKPLDIFDYYQLVKAEHEDRLIDSTLWQRLLKLGRKFESSKKQLDNHSARKVLIENDIKPVFKKVILQNSLLEFNKRIWAKLGFSFDGIVMESRPKRAQLTAGMAFAIDGTRDVRMLLGPYFAGTDTMLVASVHETLHAMHAVHATTEFYVDHDIMPDWYAEGLAGSIVTVVFGSELFRENFSLSRDVLQLIRTHLVDLLWAEYLSFSYKAERGYFAQLFTERDTDLGKIFDIFEKEVDITIKGLDQQTSRDLFLAGQARYLVTYPLLYGDYVNANVLDTLIWDRFSSDIANGNLQTYAAFLRRAFTHASNQDPGSFLKSQGIEWNDFESRIKIFARQVENVINRMDRYVYESKK